MVNTCLYIKKETGNVYKHALPIHKMYVTGKKLMLWRGLMNISKTTTRMSMALNGFKALYKLVVYVS